MAAHGSGPDPIARPAPHSADARRLRVLLATLADLERPGGVPRSVRMLAEGLRARGHDVATISCPIAAGVRRTVLRRVWRRVSPSSEEARRIHGALSRMAADFARCGARDVGIAFEAWSADVSAAAGIPTVLRVAGLGSITDEWVRNGFIAAGSRVVARLRQRESAGTAAARHVVVLGAASADAMRALGVREARLSVIHNAVAVPGGAAEERTDDAVRVVAVGNLRKVKGADVLAAALAALPDGLRERVEFIHLGEGDDDGNPVFVTARNSLTAAGVRHEFRGAVPHDAIWAVLRSADVFAFPSRVESFGNALVEALAAGLPVVATDVGAVREILGDGATTAGLVVPPDDPRRFAAALAVLLRDADTRHDWGVRNAERAARLFGVETMLDRYERVLRAAVAGS